MKFKLLKIIWSVLLFVLAFVSAGLILAVPATLSLPPGIRPGLEKLTVAEAAKKLKETGYQGWDLVKEATLLVHERIQYSRRNSFDNYERAFERGYGYCQQTAYALKSLLRELGFRTRVVQSFHNRFPNGAVGSHAWVEVTFNGQSKYFDGVFTGEDGNPTFTILGKVYPYTWWFRILAGWGSIPVNAIRYYISGKDHDEGQTESVKR